MPGFTLKYGISSYNKITNRNLISSIIKNNKFVIQRETINKFLDDKIFQENEKYIIVLEGVILNKKELLKDNWFDTIQSLYLELGETFFNKFRGSFSGLLFDKEKNKWILFTDHIGSKHIYYSSLGKGKFIFSSTIHEIIKCRKKNKLENKLNTNAAYMLLSYGYLIEKNTLILGVEKLLAGHYIIFENEKINIFRYHLFSNKPDLTLSDDDIIEKISELFNNAIKRQFDKDVEYNLKHFVGLSGGLDSRITSMVAHELGYKDQLNFTFSQTNYLDETIPKKIAEDLKHEWIFKALDNGLFMKNIDEITKISEGNVNYYGLAHGLSMYKYINFDNLGLFHTGQLGDVILGTYSSTKNNTKEFNIESGAFSKKFISKIDFNKINLDFENEEIFKFYLRGFSGMNAGLLALQRYSETISPFYDVDFMEFALSIPINKRFNHYIYKKWLMQKHPNTTKYIWEKTGKKPRFKKYNFNITIKGRTITIKQLIKKGLTKSGIIKQKTSTKNHMNPFTYWYNNNSDIKLFLDDYYTVNIKNLNDYDDLKKDAKELYKNGNLIEKGLVLSLLSYLKLMN